MEKNKELFQKMQNLVFNLDTKEEEFNFFVLQNEEELIKEDPILFIGLKVDFYLQREEIEKGLGVVLNYKNGKYISMEVEDFLNELKEEIIKDSSHKSSKLSDEELNEYLLSNNDQKIVNAIRDLSNKNIRKYISLVEKFLCENQNEKMHRLMLILLVEQQVNKEFVFKLNNVERKINPSLLKLPFETNEYNLLSTYISSLNKDPSIINRKKEIYSYILVQAYPDNPFLNFKIDEIYKYIDALDYDVCGLVYDISSLDENKYQELKDFLSR